MSHPEILAARQGKGKFQWEPGGWFGGVVGGSSWLAFGAFVLLWQGKLVPSMVSGVSWLLVLLLACWLWLRRDRIDPFQGLASVLVLLSVLMPIVWLVCWDTPTDETSPSLHWIRGFRSAAACSIVPVILACFFVQERIFTRKFQADDNSTRTDG